MASIQLARLEAYAFRVPIANPIKVAFGTFRDRPMVLVRAVEQDGSEGWGEVWCNWPAVTAEHRARLAADIGERLVGRTFQDPAHAFEQLTRELEVLALQTGEPGPIASVLAGIDIALWDLSARRGWWRRSSHRRFPTAPASMPKVVCGARSSTTHAWCATRPTAASSARSRCR